MAAQEARDLEGIDGRRRQEFTNLFIGGTSLTRSGYGSTIAR